MKPSYNSNLEIVFPGSLNDLIDQTSKHHCKRSVFLQQCCLLPGLQSSSYQMQEFFWNALLS